MVMLMWSSIRMAPKNDIFGVDFSVKRFTLGALIFLAIDPPLLRPKPARSSLDYGPTIQAPLSSAPGRDSPAPGWRAS
jgi:hypothetical protein